MSSGQPPKKDESAQAGPSTTAPSGDKAAAESGKKKLPQLGALEDDDEFEEWNADLQGGGLAEALAKAGTAQDGMWEENWDDDDIEDDFTKKIREAIANRMGAPDEQMKE